MKPQKILDFLNTHPDFLAEHAETLGIRLKDDKVRSFAQGQVVASRIKTEKMTQRMEDMLDAAQRNHITMQRLLKFDLRLLQAKTLNQVVKAVSASLNDDFGLPYFSFKLIVTPKIKTKLPESLNLPEHLKIAAEWKKLKQPICSQQLSGEARALLPNDVILESFLQLPLWFGKYVGGVLLLGHPDPHHFAPDLPTEYVQRLAEALSAVLARLTGWRHDD